MSARGAKVACGLLAVALCGCLAPAGGAQPGDVVTVTPGLADRSPHAEAALDRAQSLLDSEEPSRAAAELQYALRLDARLYRAHYLLGTCYYKLGQYELEANEYAKCLAINPGYAAALADLGHCWLSLDRLEQAREAYYRYLVLRPRDGQVVYNLALVEQDLGNEAASRELFRRLVKLPLRSR
jgi:tetratricopeptide (TPR) repeat protein